MNKESTMRVAYQHPVTMQLFSIPLAALATYKRRDAALQKMIDLLDGLDPRATRPSPELLRQRKIMMAAKRKIEREGWTCTVVH